MIKYSKCFQEEKTLFSFYWGKVNVLKLVL